MDRNRLLLFIALSAAILFGFQILLPGPRHVAVQNAALTQQAPSTTADTHGTTGPAAPTPSHISTAPSRNVPRAGQHRPGRRAAG